MDEALYLTDYLPASFRSPEEQEYISFLWETFEENYVRAKYQFAFLAYHMLMMSFVYFNIWQLRQTRREDFQKGLIGFPKESEKTLLDAPSPFIFGAVGESLILRLLRLMGCDDTKIGQYTKLVRDRNNAAHANGRIFPHTQREADIQIREVLRAVHEIQTHSQPIINQCYEKFLFKSRDPDDREYPDTDDQIREVLIHGNYMSQKDIELCVNFDISVLGDDNKETIEALHRSLCETYGTENQDTQ